MTTSAFVITLGQLMFAIVDGRIVIALATSFTNKAGK